MFIFRSVQTVHEGHVLHLECLLLTNLYPANLLFLFDVLSQMQANGPAVRNISGLLPRLGVAHRFWIRHSAVLGSSSIDCRFSVLLLCHYLRPESAFHAHAEHRSGLRLAYCILLDSLREVPEEPQYSTFLFKIPIPAIKSAVSVRFCANYRWL